MSQKKGWKLSEETKKKMSIARKGGKPFLGKKHTEETKARIKKSMKKFQAEKKAERERKDGNSIKFKY